MGGEFAREGDPDVGPRLRDVHEAPASTVREGVASLHAVDEVQSSGAKCPGEASTEGQPGEGRHVAKKAKTSGGRTTSKADQEEQTIVSPGSASAGSKAAKGQKGIKSFFKADKGGKG